MTTKATAASRNTRERQPARTKATTIADPYGMTTKKTTLKTLKQAQGWRGGGGKRWWRRKGNGGKFFLGEGVSISLLAQEEVFVGGRYAAGGRQGGFWGYRCRGGCWGRRPGRRGGGRTTR